MLPAWGIQAGFLEEWPVGRPRSLGSIYLYRLRA